MFVSGEQPVEKAEVAQGRCASCGVRCGGKEHSHRGERQNPEGGSRFNPKGGLRYGFHTVLFDTDTYLKP